MSEFKEFEGKTIDDAINLACATLGAEREKLEIDIIQDSKGGIFGLVGAKKAIIQAKLRDSNAELRQLVTSVVEKLVKPIVDTPEIEIEIEDKERVKVTILGEENSGLLIGREGQTLASIQYLVNRIMAKKVSDPLRIQIDTGDYRERQDDNLRQLALHLADKASSLGRAQSTKPLSSYHRRVVHMTLQDNEAVSTKSKGEGPLKRVLILPKRTRPQRPFTPGREDQGYREREPHRPQGDRPYTRNNNPARPREAAPNAEGNEPNGNRLEFEDDN
jgi:spoIIIJ-associated protein